MSNRAEWERVHQPYEFRFHQGQNYRWEGKYEIEWSRVADNMRCAIVAAQ